MSCEVPRRLVAQFYTFRVSADFVSLKGTSSFAQRCTESCSVRNVCRVGRIPAKLQTCSVRNVCRVGRIPAKLQSTTDNHTHTHTTARRTQFLLERCRRICIIT